MRVSEQINRIADVLERRGWRTGSAGWTPEAIAGEDALCLEGAMQAVLGLPWTVMPSPDGETYEACPTGKLNACEVGKAIRAYLDLDWLDPLWRWNDRRANSLEEVVGVLRATALIEAAREDGSLVDGTILIGRTVLEAMLANHPDLVATQQEGWWYVNLHGVTYRAAVQVSA